MPLFDNFSSSTGDFLNCTLNATNPDCDDGDIGGFLGMFFGIFFGGMALALCAYTRCCGISKEIQNWRRKNAEPQENSALIDKLNHGPQALSYDGSKPSPTKAAAVMVGVQTEPKSITKSPNTLKKENLNQDIQTPLLSPLLSTSAVALVPDNKPDIRPDNKPNHKQAPPLIPLMTLKAKQKSNENEKAKNLQSAANTLPDSDNVRVSIN